MNYYFLRIINIFLRLVTLGAKFLFIIVIAKYLSPEDVTEYGIVSSGIGYMIYVLGLDFYTFANRETILSKSRNAKGKILYNQHIIYLLLYAISLPIAIVYFTTFSNYTWEISVLIVMLIFFEHLCQEWNRILISVGRINSASILLFVRGASWTIVLTTLFMFFENSRNFETVIYIWTLGSIFSVTLCVSEAFRFKKNFIFDAKWIKRGIWRSIPFFVSSLSGKAILTFDRFIIGVVSIPSISASYIFYSTISNAILAIVDAVIVSFDFPRVVKSVENKQTLKKEVNTMFVKCMLVSLIVSFFIYVFVDVFVGYFDEVVYLENIHILKYFLLCSVVTSMSLPFHIGLYAMKKDNVLMALSIVSFVSFLLIASVALYSSKGYMCVIYAVLCSSVMTLISKLMLFEIFLEKMEENI